MIITSIFIILSKFQEHTSLGRLVSLKKMIKKFAIEKDVIPSQNYYLTRSNGENEVAPSS